MENDTTSLSDRPGPAVLRSEPESDENRVVRSPRTTGPWLGHVRRRWARARACTAYSSLRQMGRTDRGRWVSGQAQDGDGCARNHAVPGPRLREQLAPS